MAEVVLRRLPKKIENKKVVFAFANARSAPDNLGVKRAYFCRAQTDNAVYARFVEALGQQHRIAQNAAFARMQTFEDFAPVG